MTTIGLFIIGHVYHHRFWDIEDFGALSSGRNLLQLFDTCPTEGIR